MSRKLALISGVVASVLVGSIANADTTLGIHYQWIDGFGSSAHDLRGTSLEFWDDDTNYDIIPNADDFIASLTTNNSGVASTTTSVNDGIGDGTLELYSIMSAELSGVASVRTSHAGSVLTMRNPTGTGMFPNTIDAVNANGGPTSFASTTDFLRGLSVLQFVQHINAFYSAAPYSATLPACTIVINNAFGDAANMGSSQMNLGNAAWHDVDVIMHEYGHHVQEYNNLRVGTLANGHSFGTDNIGTANGGAGLGADVGSRLAWQEGGATALGMFATHVGNLNGAIPNLYSGDYDLWYDDYTHTGQVATINTSDLSFAVNIETRGYIYTTGGSVNQGGTVTSTTFAGAGEGDELSVMRVIWDYRDPTGETYARGLDYSFFGAPTAYDKMKNVGTLYAYWQAMGATARADKSNVGNPAPDAEVMGRMGCTLEEYAVSSIPVTTGVVPAMPTFVWSEQNNDNSAFYRVLVYSSDFSSLVLDSGQLNSATVGDLVGAMEADLSWTSTTALDPGNYNWVALNDPRLSTAGDLIGIYNWYWSGWQQIEVLPVPEPSSLGLVALGASLLIRRRS